MEGEEKKAAEKLGIGEKAKRVFNFSRLVCKRLEVLVKVEKRRVGEAERGGER